MSQVLETYMSIVKKPLALLALTTALCGCSAIPNADVRTPAYNELRARKGAVMDSNVSIAPIKIAVKGAGQEGYKLTPIARAEMLQTQLQRWIEGGGLFRRVVTLKDEEGQTVDGQAWVAGTDLIVETTVTQLNTSFKDHNGWWVPNMVNWFMFMIPAWWVATDEYQVTGIVVGLPLHMSGEESEKSVQARSYGRWLQKVTGQPVGWQDERLSSAQADVLMRSTNLTASRRKQHRDKLAAQVILQTWLDRRQVEQ